MFRVTEMVMNAEKCAKTVQSGLCAGGLSAGGGREGGVSVQACGGTQGCRQDRKLEEAPASRDEASPAAGLRREAARGGAASAPSPLGGLACQRSPGSGPAGPQPGPGRRGRGPWPRRAGGSEEAAPGPPSPPPRPSPPRPRLRAARVTRVRHAPSLCLGWGRAGGLAGRRVHREEAPGRTGDCPPPGPG